MSDTKTTKVENAKGPTLADKVAAAVDKWVVEHLHNSDFSRDTPAWNHFQSKKDALVKAIEQGVK